MAFFTCTTCGYYNTVVDGQQYAVCPRCGTWFYLHQPPQNPFSYSPPTTYNYQQPQAPASKPEPQEYIPKVPAGNRYAGHDKVIAKMAKGFADRVFRHIKATPWRPVTKEIKVADYELFINFGYGHFSCGFDGYSTIIQFVDYGMNSIPDIDAFKLAIEPALKFYLKEKAQEKFGNIHRLSSYTVDGGIRRCRTDNKTLFMEFYITQTLHPDNLRSW